MHKLEGAATLLALPLMSPQCGSVIFIRRLQEHRKQRKSDLRKVCDETESCLSYCHSVGKHKQPKLTESRLFAENWSWHQTTGA